MPKSTPAVTNSVEATAPGGEAFAIETFSLTRRFGDLIAADHVTLHVRYGAIFGLLGPNGAGKTTTIKMLTTMLDPTEGTASVAGFDIVKTPAKVRRMIGYVPQMLSADGGLTGWENLALSAQPFGTGRPQPKPPIQEALRFMGLSDFGRN